MDADKYNSLYMILFDLFIIGEGGGAEKMTFWRSAMFSSY